MYLSFQARKLWMFKYLMNNFSIVLLFILSWAMMGSPEEDPKINAYEGIVSPYLQYRFYANLSASRK